MPRDDESRRLSMGEKVMSIRYWTKKTTLELVGVIALIPFSTWILCNEQATHSYLKAWIITLVLLIVFTMVCGRSITGRTAGALIDNRNVMSLSRFQLLSWTLLILSAFVTVALLQAFGGNNSTIDVNPELWALLGISTTTMLSSPLMLENKTAQTPDAEELKTNIRNLEKLGDTEATLSNKGLVVINTDISKARFSDMFTGEETGNAAHIDLARLQMLLFTVVSIMVYAFKIGGQISNLRLDADWVFPVMDQGMVALIGISHGGYLLAKAGPQSKRGNEAGNTSNTANTAKTKEEGATKTENETITKKETEITSNSTK